MAELYPQSSGHLMSKGGRANEMGGSSVLRD